MIKRIENVFSEVTGRDDLNFTEETPINSDMGFSSLSFVQIICALEDEFDVDVPNSTIKKIKTVGDIVKFLEENA